MSVLLWWLPALLLVVIAWWRLRPTRRTLRDKDFRRMARLLGGDR